MSTKPPVARKSRYHTAPHTFATKFEAEAWLGGRARRRGPPVITARLRTSPCHVRRLLGALDRRWWAQPRQGPAAAHGRALPPVAGQAAAARVRPPRLDEITPDSFGSGSATSDDTGPVMRSHAYTLLRGIMATAVDDELIVTNPCRVRGASAQAHTRDVKVLTPGEIVSLAEAAPDRYRLFVLLAAWCQLRQGELVELRRQGRQPDAGTVRVERAVVRVKGTQQVGPPKSHAGSARSTFRPTSFRWLPTTSSGTPSRGRMGCCSHRRQVSSRSHPRSTSGSERLVTTLVVPIFGYTTCGIRA